jgi:hypothetical protein
MLGMHGTVAANFAVNDSDLLLAFGVRFDDRVTGREGEFCIGSFPFSMHFCRQLPFLPGVLRMGKHPSFLLKLRCCPCFRQTGVVRGTRTYCSHRH